MRKCLFANGSDWHRDLYGLQHPTPVKCSITDWSDSIHQQNRSNYTSKGIPWSVLSIRCLDCSEHCELVRFEVEQPPHVSNRVVQLVFFPIVWGVSDSHWVKDTQSKNSEKVISEESFFEWIGIQILTFSKNTLANWRHYRTHDTLFDFPKITYVEEGNEIWFLLKHEGLNFRLWRDMNWF